MGFGPVLAESCPCTAQRGVRFRCEADVRLGFRFPSGAKIAGDRLWPKADGQNHGLNVRFGEDSPISRNGSSVCQEAPASAFSTLGPALRGEAYSSITIRIQSVLDARIDRGKHPCLSLGWHSPSVHNFRKDADRDA